ncbi:MAG TPA: hypothetical protein PK762_07330, partial [Candidatus Kapabacteria bacterium]|nr:hypothetical protein [Candidatus Kapabacteria bacterium]
MTDDEKLTAESRQPTADSRQLTAINHKERNKMNKLQNKIGIKSFPFNYWLVIIFEFFERGSYYGVMSFLSIYLTSELGFSKEG